MTCIQAQILDKNPLDMGQRRPMVGRVTIARSLIIREDGPGAYHLISRCVRRAYLCGDDAEHRRGWLERGIETQAKAFAIDVLTYAIMSNHLHIVVRTDPARVREWSPREVVMRWAILFPRISHETGEAGAWHESEIDLKTQDSHWVEACRERLSSVSWFMRLLKQRVARKANAEDGVTGHFWEGRFQSVPLLDEAAVLSCMAYVDLNPIRAAIAATPEDSDYTGVQRRVQARQEQRQAQALLEADTDAVDPLEMELARDRLALGEEHGLWIVPCLQATGGHCSVNQYLELVDQTGRILKDGKRGTIPAHLAPILQRLDIDVDNWLAVMLSHGKFHSTAVGTLAALISEAARRGVKWIVDKTGIHRERRRTRPKAASTA